MSNVLFLNYFSEHSSLLFSFFEFDTNLQRVSANNVNSSSALLCLSFFAFALRWDFESCTGSFLLYGRCSFEIFEVGAEVVSNSSRGILTPAIVDLCKVANSL